MKHSILAILAATVLAPALSAACGGSGLTAEGYNGNQEALSSILKEEIIYCDVDASAIKMAKVDVFAIYRCINSPVNAYLTLKGETERTVLSNIEETKKGSFILTTDANQKVVCLTKSFIFNRGQ